eukprot:gi/632988574/ref/XP_007883187.1/ PREDICTED: keratin, type I cytoskeletal 18-like [Callorhinchus milii]
MKGLNERLAGYLGKVRDLEANNTHLEQRIQAALGPRGPHTDWGSYEKPVADLRHQVMDMTMENASLALQMDNGRLAADDFKVKWEAELSTRQSVQQDINGLRKILDDTNVARVQMGSQIENLKEELTFLRKNHQEEVEKLKAQIANSSVSVRVNDRKNVDLGDIMSKIREKYEKIADQNREDIEQMYQTKFQDLSQAVARGNDAVQLAKRDANNLRCQVQPLEAELNGLLIQNRSLEQTLGDTEDRWNSELDELNRTIAKLEQELRMLCSHIEQQAEKYQSLLDVKCKLDREISAYQGLLEEDAIHPDPPVAPVSARGPDSQKQANKRIVIISRRTADGTVSTKESNEFIH